MLEAVSAFMVENGLSFRDFNNWIIAYDPEFPPFTTITIWLMP
jgi:hypothetical protein